IRYIVINKYRNLTPQKITQLRGDASLLIAENLNTNKQYWSENEPGFPVSFRELGAVSAGVNDRWPGAVNITTSLGFSHRGLFIIVSPTSFSLAKRSELPPLKEVGDNV